MADGGSSWYFTRKEIEENSPSRRDGIDLKKETDFRKSYSSFLHELGVKLFVPQVMISTAIVFCHRFFLRQSHAKHDRFKIATACMYLATKVEGTPRPLRNFVVISFQIIHKKDPKTHQSIVGKKEVYEEQKDLMLQEEKLVIETLEFDFDICHPYKPLLEAIKKVKGVANRKALTQVAWNFVNDGFRTSLCLQMKPHIVAAGSLFLAAKFLKIQLHWDGRKTWWQEFSVTPRQLEEVSHQLLELYEQDRAPILRASQDDASGENAISSDSSVDQANVHNENQNPQDTDFEKLEPEINYNRQSTKQEQLSPDHSTSMVDFEPQDQQEQGNIGGRMETLELNNIAVSQPAPTTNNCDMILMIKLEILEKRRNSGPN